jgi:Flp pilus assembly pilin Flp
VGQLARPTRSNRSQTSLRRHVRELVAETRACALELTRSISVRSPNHEIGGFPDRDSASIIVSGSPNWRRGHAETVSTEVFRRVASRTVSFSTIDFGGFRSSDRDSRRGRGELRPAPTVRKEVNHMLKFYTWAQARLADEEGAAMAEYAVILALITAVVAGLFTTLGGQINGVLQEVIDAFN